MAIRQFEKRECDRCGTQADVRTDDNTFGDWIKGTLNTSDRYYGRQTLPEKFDLCQSCGNALVEWWQKP